MSTPPPPPGYNPPPPPYSGPPVGAQYGAPAPPPPGYQSYQQPGYQQPGYQQPGYQQPGYREYAGIGARFGARLLDGLIGALFSLPAIIALFAAPRHYTSCTVNGESGICHVPTGGSIALIVLLAVVGSIAYLVIYCRKMGKGQTWGQKACGVRVVDKGTNQPIGTGRAVGRFFAQYLSAIPCYLGFFWALWDKEKQTWHDKLVNSVVIKA